MRRLGKQALLIVTSLATSAGAAPPADGNAVQQAIRLGTAMFWYDQAAWVSSDDLLAKIPADRRSEVGGWIVTPAVTGLHVDYINRAMPDRVVYSVEVNKRALSDARLYPAGKEPPLGAIAARMLRAQNAAHAELARHSDWHSCVAAPFNTIVLPQEADGTVPVYFLTPQTENGSFPFGGHYRIDVAADGHIVRARAFARSCISLKQEAPSSGAAPVGAFITHGLDSQPTEVHVFEQLNMRLPLYVGIAGSRTIWKIENGAMTHVDPATAG